MTRSLWPVFVATVLIGTALPASAGCVVPPPLERESNVDAAVNAIPVIIGLDPRFPSPGPITIRRGEQETMTLVVRDTDLRDTIWIYFFVDYNYPNPVPHLSTCQSSVQELDRTITCPLNAICAFAQGPPDQLHVLEAMVTDRALLLDGEPMFRALPAGVGVSFRTWLMHCAE